MTTAPPILVVGAPRSGTTLLACSLGQHRRIETVWAPDWAGRLGDPANAWDLPPAHRSGKTRWVDGSPEVTRLLVSLLAVFPAARVIHTVRELDAPDELAHERLQSTISACATIVAGLGESGLTVLFDELLDDPERTLRACLGFVGEEYSAACLRPCRLQRGARA